MKKKGRERDAKKRRTKNKQTIKHKRPTFSDYVKLRHNDEGDDDVDNGGDNLGNATLNQPKRMSVQASVRARGRASRSHTNNLSILIIFHLLDYIKRTKSRKKLHENYSHISKYPLNVYLGIFGGAKSVLVYSHCPCRCVPCECAKHLLILLFALSLAHSLARYKVNWVNCNICSPTHWSRSLSLRLALEW